MTEIDTNEVRAEFLPNGNSYLHTPLSVVMLINELCDRIDMIRVAWEQETILCDAARTENAMHAAKNRLGYAEVDWHKAWANSEAQYLQSKEFAKVNFDLLKVVSAERDELQKKLDNQGTL